MTPPASRSTQQSSDLAILFYAASTILGVWLVFAVNLGWRPAVAPLWDGRTLMAVLMGGGFAGLMSSMALGPFFARWRPRRLWLVACAPMIIVSALLIGAYQLSPGDSTQSLIENIEWSLGVGAAFAAAIVLIGFGASFLPKKDDEAPNTGETSAGASHALIVLILLGIWAGAAAVTFWPHERDDGRTIYRARFHASCGVVEVAATKAPLLGGAYGLLVVSDGRRENRLVLHPGEWPELQQAWAAARGKDGRWRTGEVRDNIESNPARLRLSVGSVARFEVTSRRGPDLNCDLPASRFADFGRALDEMSARILR